MQYKSYQSRKEQLWLLVELVLRATNTKASDEEIATQLRYCQAVGRIEDMVERIARLKPDD